MTTTTPKTTTTTITLVSIILLLLVNSGDSTIQIGRLICTSIKRSLTAPYGCTKCSATIRVLFRKTVRLEAACTVPPPLYSNITTLATSFVGNYYSSKTTLSNTKIIVPLSGNYSGYPIPSNTNITISVTYKKPLSNPFQVATCTATTTIPSPQGVCTCAVCPTAVNKIVFNCANLILIPNATYPDQVTDIYYPDTSTDCFDPVALLFQK